MSKSALRVVARDERAPAPMSLAEAVESGDYLAILKAQRREIAGSLPDERGPAKAALHRQLSLVSKEIELLETRGRAEEVPGEPVSAEPFDAATI